ncbi:family 1 glycosylhydrolase [Nocardia arthritidis]|nr:family 1 glycosylhydrolase [Nocardia arthritidis]
MWVAAPASAGGVPGLGPGFLWGVAESGFQSEGHVRDSNWRRYIDAHPEMDRYGDSVDFFDRYGADIDLAAALGAKVYRIGVEWSRLQPNNSGEWDEAGFRFYDGVIAKIAASGMRPMITLDHWVYPGWAYDRGGWADPAMVGNWLADMRKVVDRYASRNPLWVTINEPVAYITMEARYRGTDAAVMLDRVAEAHNQIYDYIHQVRPDAWVTSNFGYVAGNDDQVNGPTLARIGAKLDYIGIDYYFGFEPWKAIALPAILLSGSAGGSSQIWDLPLHTEGIYYALQRYSRLFPGKPLYIVENGMPTDNGLPRPDGYTRADHLRDIVYWIQRATADGMNVIGYNYWSITDNYEWGSYRPRFGLYTVDVPTDSALTRRATDAVAAYSGIIAGNGVPADYRPTRGPALCILVDPPASCLTPATVP